MPFNEFLDLLLMEHPKNVHTQKQILFTGGHEIDELCPIESLNERWAYIRDRFSLGDLPKAHNASPHSHWSNYYSDSQKDRAEEVFKEDLDLYKLALEKYYGNYC